MTRIMRLNPGWSIAPAVFVPLLSLAVVLNAHGNPDGAGKSTQIPAYYDGELFKINIMELNSSDPLIRNNKSINTIYVSDDLDEEQQFVPVISAIQGDGFNPLWRQVLIVFNDGFEPHQFFSDEEVVEAAEGTDPEITLMVTDEIYLCAVSGPKK